jgi:DNA-binding NarL/FixJ family response regulator
VTALLIVEDNATFADTLVQFLGRFGDYSVAAWAATGEAALDLLPELAVDLALIDVSLPGMSGIDLVSAVRRLRPDLPCIMLSGHHDRLYVRRALAAGARGYVLKQNPIDLVEALRLVPAGEIYLSAELQAEINSD